jgi:hypothetical protein
MTPGEKDERRVDDVAAVFDLTVRHRANNSGEPNGQR